MQLTHSSTGFLVIQVLNFLLTLGLLVHTWRRDRPMFWLIPAATLFGFVVEYSQVSKAQPLYYYTEGLLSLPGPVPLTVVLSWGTVIYAALSTARALTLPPLLTAVAAALLATAIDFVSDPAFVGLGVWVWNPPGAWFGIPWDNYVGWFVIVVSYVSMLELADRLAPRKPWLAVIAPFIAIVPAFLCFVAVMLGYLWLTGHHLLAESTLVALFFGFWLALLLAWLPRMKGDAHADGWTLAPPAFLYATSLAILFLTPLHRTQPTLVLVMPAFTLLGMAGYLWPYRRALGLARASFHDGAHRAHLAPVLLAALVPILAFAAFAPHRGLIGPVTLPGDDAFLPDEKVQWWYWTGHLESEEGRRFGFEVVIFTFDSFLFMRDQLTQVAVTDVDKDSFHFAEHLKFHLPGRDKDRFALAAGPGDIIRAAGDIHGDRLHSEVDGYVLDLQLARTEAPVLHYGGNAHPYRFGGYTYYYSRERMATKGTLTVDGKTYKVSGTSWFDRQYGDLYQAIVKGWQWFAIELADHRQVMLYDILGKSNASERSGSITDAEGNTRVLAGHQFKVEVLGKWKSPHTGCTYPSGWRVTVENETFEVRPLVKDQELRAHHDFWPGPEYWEGAASVLGAAPGQAYVELNGYCRGAEGTINF